MAKPLESAGGKRQPNGSGDHRPNRRVTFDEWVALGQPEGAKFIHRDGRSVALDLTTFHGRWNDFSVAAKVWWGTETHRVRSLAEAEVLVVASDPTHRHQQYAAEIAAIFVAARIAS